MRNALPLAASAGLLISGFALSTYLFARSILLVLGRTAGAFDLCSVALNASCDSTLLSSQSQFLGIPVAGWGMVYYSGLIAILLVGYLAGPRLAPAASVGALVGVTGGVVISVVLLSTFVTGAVPVCPLCIAVHGINFLLWPLLYKLTGRSFKGLAGAVGMAALFIIGHDKRKGIVDAPLKALSFLLAGLVALSVYQWVSQRYERAEVEARSTPSETQILMGHVLRARQDIPIGADDPRRGPEDSAVEFVVFSDFQCPGCQIIAQRLDGYVEKFEGLVSIVFKHFPLDSACNPNVEKPLHDVACRAAVLSEQARRLGKFWTFHDAVFSRDEALDDDVLDRIAAEIGLDNLPETDRRQDEDRVARHMREAAALDVQATPTVFLNGRLVANPIERALDILVWHTIGAETKEGGAYKESAKIKLDEGTLATPAMAKGAPYGRRLFITVPAVN